MQGGARGSFGIFVWPAYVGAVTSDGREPALGADYRRCQIHWGTDHGEIVGRANIELPASLLPYTHLIYTHHPTQPVLFTAQKLSHPFHFPQGGTIHLDGITERDVTPMKPDPVLHD